VDFFHGEVAVIAADIGRDGAENIGAVLVELAGHGSKEHGKGRSLIHVHQVKRRQRGGFQHRVAVLVEQSDAHAHLLQRHAAGVEHLAQHPETADGRLAEVKAPYLKRQGRGCGGGIRRGLQLLLARDDQLLADLQGAWVQDAVGILQGSHADVVAVGDREQTLTRLYCVEDRRGRGSRRERGRGRVGCGRVCGGCSRRKDSHLNRGGGRGRGRGRNGDDLPAARNQQGKQRNGGWRYGCPSWPVKRSMPHGREYTTGGAGRSNRAEMRQQPGWAI